jgi:hypothetical protein
MLNARDQEALIDKAVNQSIEIVRRFGGNNVTDFVYLSERDAAKGCA